MEVVGEKAFLQKQAVKKTLKQFKRITFSFSFFKIFFCFLFLFELILFFLNVLFFARSAFIASALGALFLTTFTYFVLLFYFQTKKPEEMQSLKDRFITSCRRSISLPEGTTEHHLLVAQAALNLSSYLYNFEYCYYVPPGYLGFLKFILKKFSFYFHRRDVFKMKELLLYSAIDEHIKQIRITPTDLEVHASLANTYVILSKLYLDAIEENSNKKRKSKELSFWQEKYDISSKWAIEEFKILSNYAPNDPWVHAQLARCYHTLKMYQKEALEYEKILQLSPNDSEILYRLAKIYFQIGENAKALRIFERLKRDKLKKADDLLWFYGAVHVRNLIEDSY